MADQSIHPMIAPSDQELEFELNGRTVKAKKGESIIQVAAREGVYVPHYCWHPSLSVAGNCRLCLVEMHMPDPKQPGKRVPGMKPVIGCQTAVVAGSAVFTESDLAVSCQKGMMEFLLVNHPLDCPICDRGGECMLQRYSMEYGGGHTRMADKKRKFRKPQADPLIDIERNRCIMCTRCVRFCDEVAGEHVMGVFDRGEGNYIGTFGQGPISNILSGNVIDICPVGCLTSKPFRFKARVWELKQTQSTGIFDASGPKVTYWTRNGRLYRTTPPSRKYHDTYSVNEDTQEFIDNLTRFGSDFSHHADRWDESRVRMGSTLLPCARIEAIRAAASGLAKVKVNHGANAIAVLVSPRATLEEGYLAAKVARAAIGTDSVDWRTSMRNDTSVEAVDIALAHADGDLSRPFDTLVLVNGDYLHTVPTLAMHLKERARINNLPVVMLGHHHDAYFAPHAKMAFHTMPGGTAAVLSLLANVLRLGPSDAMMERLAELLGCSTARAQELIDLLKKAQRGLVVQSLEDMNGLFLIEEVATAIATKQSLGPNWGYLPTLRDRNAVGLRVVGVQPGRMPSDMASMVRAWGRERLPNTGGIMAPDLLSAIESGQVKGLLCIGADALANYSERDRMLAALDKLEFFAVSDLFKSEITEKASVFFAAASNLEREGTYVDIQGNLARLCEAEPPSGGSRPDWETLTQLGAALGSGGFDYKSIEDVFREMMSLIAPGFRGTFKGLELAGPANDITIADPGGARRNTPEYNPGDFREDGAHFRFRGNELPVPGNVDPRAMPEGEGLVLTYGEHLQTEDYHLNRATIAHLLKVPAYVEINPADAASLDIEENQMVALELASGISWEAAARLRSGPAPGTVYVPVGVGPAELRLAGKLQRVRVTPLESRGAEQELVVGSMMS